MTRVILAVLALTVLSSHAFATDQDTFTKGLAKVAPPIAVLLNTFKPRLFCACNATLAPGVLTINFAGNAECVAPLFDGTGKLISLAFCNGGDFIVLH